MRFTVRRGQLALLGVIILAGTLIAIISARTPSPLIAYERGHLQAAQLIHLARVCFSTTCSAQRAQALLSTLTALNASELLRMYPTSLQSLANSTVRAGRGWLTEYRLVFSIATPAGGEVVSYYARVENLGEEGSYTKTLFAGGTARALTMVRVRLRYTNDYASPFFNLSSLCPKLSDPQGVADMLSFSTAGCEWLVGVPRELSTRTSSAYVYKLRDQWGVVIPVYYEGG